MGSNASHSSTNKQSNDGSEKSLLVGSQKRKARKQSITRNAGASGTGKNDDDQETKGTSHIIIHSSSISVFK